jgi:hypothetical protein
MHWRDRYVLCYGFWRPYVTDVIYRYLACGDLHFGFARVHCQDYGHEYFLARKKARAGHHPAGPSGMPESGPSEETTDSSESDEGVEDDTLRSIR